MARIHKGQTVKITIDAMPDKRFIGTVSAISSSTGSKYSLIPIDNSAGNFVKIQQRIPVRIFSLSSFRSPLALSQGGDYLKSMLSKLE